MSELNRLISELKAVSSAGFSGNIHGIDVDDLIATVTRLEKEAEKVSESKKLLIDARNRLNAFADH